ncbi:MAG: helicase-exonuclease AddAB subunit AddA [Firmicutes bacterium]|nr:helicase-exonuclease AddAB subunit AddA [Bacillota bacterium]
MINWTDKQRKAIYDRDKSLLVAAAAGSGKTAVLVERIKQLILKDNCSLERMLVVTFTNAAASEMKAKIEEAIRKEINALSEELGREAEEKTVLLKRQLDLLPMAQISTFHSFAMEIVKKFFFTIGCEPNFKICDDANRAILEANAMDKLFEGRFEEGDKDFLEFLRKFGGARSDDRVKDMIYSLSARLEAMPYPDEWLDQKTEELKLDVDDLKDAAIFKEIWEAADRVMERCLDVLTGNLEYAGAIGLVGGNIPASDMNKLLTLKEAFDSRDIDKAKVAFGAFKLDTMYKKFFTEAANPGLTALEIEEAKGHIEYGRNYVKKAIKALEDDLFSSCQEEVAKDIRATYEDVRYLGGLVREFEALYSEEKKSRGLMDFSDLEHYAFEILKNEEVAGFYRSHFEYIFVDEYQDSNVLQEALIGRIASERNLFTVGDVKQSIYKFRLAEPDIFKARYKKYKEEAAALGENSTSEKIDLNQNFRSKNSVIDFINEVFGETMEGYGEEEALHPGDPHAGEDNYEPCLFLADEDWEEDQEIDDAIKELKKTEKEALLAVKLIRGYLGKPIFDSKKGEERPLTKRDIVILMRSIKGRGDIFYKVLMENNIPCYVDDNKGYFDTIEINTFMSLMELIDNHKQDVQLLTVMRSEILDFEISELAEIRAAHREGSFYDSLVAYSEEGTSEELKEKCSNALNSIASWQELARVTPLEELVWTLMIDTGFYAAMGAMPGGALRQANLRLLADKALDYRKNQKGGLYGFIKYVDHIKEKEINMGQARVISEDEDTVRIMTIHHSKGLEFPMVLIAGYTRQLKGNSKQGRLYLHKDLGIGLSIVDHEHFWYRNTILQTLIKRRINLEENEEEKRILYVAMTRAKDILLMTGTAKNPQETVDKVMTSLPKDSTYFDMTGRTIGRSALRIVKVEDRELARIAGVRKRSLSRALEVLDGATFIPDEETERIMNFRYPYEEELKIKSKYSVSELNRGERIEVPTFDPSVPRLPEESGLSASHRGTVTHSVLEKMDFARVGSLSPEEGIKAIEDLIRNMIDKESLTEEEGEAVNAGSLYEFAVSPLGRRIGKAQSEGRLRREVPFNIIMPVEGDDAMVQGIIDCWFEQDGAIDLVDYKTTAPRNVPGIRERYKVQMDIYRDALMKSTGLEVRETYLYLTNLGVTVDMN